MQKKYFKNLLAGFLVVGLGLFSFGQKAAAVGDVPLAPTNINVSGPSSGQIDLTWDAASDADTSSEELIYVIYRNGQALASTDAGVLSYSDTALTPQTSYNYNVASQDPEGNQSSWSATASISTGTSTNNSTSTEPAATDTSTTTPSSSTSAPNSTTTPAGTSTTTPSSTSTPSSNPTSTPQAPVWNFSGDVGFMVIPLSLFERFNSTSSSASTSLIYTYDQYGYPMYNGNYVDCNGNIDNDPGHHTKDIFDTDPAHNVGKNCPGGMPLAPMGNNSNMDPNSWNNNWQTMSFWSVMSGSMEQWVILPINSSTLQKLHHILQ